MVIPDDLYRLHFEGCYSQVYRHIFIGHVVAAQQACVAQPLTPKRRLVRRCTITHDGSEGRWYAGIPVSNFGL